MSAKPETGSVPKWAIGVNLWAHNATMKWYPRLRPLLKFLRLTPKGKPADTPATYMEFLARYRAAKARFRAGQYPDMVICDEQTLRVIASQAKMEGPRFAQFNHFLPGFNMDVKVLPGNKLEFIRYSPERWQDLLAAKRSDR